MDNTSLALCAGNGVCVGCSVNASHPAIVPGLLCACQPLYDAATDCSSTFFKSVEVPFRVYAIVHPSAHFLARSVTWNCGIISELLNRRFQSELAQVSIVYFLIVAAAFLADLIPDLRAFGCKGLKRPLVLAKIFAFFFGFFFILGCSWVLVNTYFGKSELWVAPLRGVVQSLYAMCYGIHTTLMIATWSELVERNRSPKERKMLKKLRISLYCLLGAILVPLVVVMIARTLIADPSSNAFKIANNSVAIIPTVYLFILEVMAAVALCRSRYWWLHVNEQTNLNAYVRKKTIFFACSILAMFCMHGFLFLNFLDTSFSVSGKPLQHFIILACYGVVYAATFSLSFMFHQRNIFTEDGFMSEYWQLERDLMFGPTRPDDEPCSGNSDTTLSPTKSKKSEQTEEVNAMSSVSSEVA